MKLFLIVSLLFYSGFLSAAVTKNEWNSTSLTTEVIKKIQTSQRLYKECVINAMQESNISQQESRKATDGIIKKCEPVLAKMRDVYLEVKVPQIIADRHLKKLRIQITRKLLKELMFREANKKAGK